MFRILLATVTLACATCYAERDFLRADEVDQIRLAQEPNIRLQLYVKYAQERLALLELAVAQEKPGRSRLIHELLEDFTKIIEAIDVVSDDALKRKVDVSEGMKVVAEANAAMAEKLEHIRDAAPKDIARYQFALDNAIETTRDSAELAQEDLGQRSEELAARAKKEQQERETMMRPEEVAAKREVEKEEAKTKRKAPSLRRPGEVPKER